MNVFIQITIDYICTITWYLVFKYIVKCLKIVRSCLRQNIKSQKKGKQKNECTHPLLRNKVQAAPLGIRAQCQKKNIQSGAVQTGLGKLLHFKRPRIQASL